MYVMANQFINITEYLSEHVYPSPSVTTNHLNDFVLGVKEFLTAGLLFVSPLLEYIMFMVFALVSLISFYYFTGGLIYLFFNMNKPVEKDTRVLIVTCHPDDECLFFGPTILKLREMCNIHLLCLTKGNYRTEGGIRKSELWKSCEVLGIPLSNITLMSVTKMPDNPHTYWDPKWVSRIICEEVERKEIKEVYTFDINGVTGHFNHCSLYYAVAYMCLSKMIPPYCRVYLLDTVNIFRKNVLFLDSLMTLSPTSDLAYTCSISESSIIRKALLQHKSQLVVSRTLLMYFSRYMYINTYKKLEEEDILLLLQIHGVNDILLPVGDHFTDPQNF